MKKRGDALARLGAVAAEANKLAASAAETQAALRRDAAARAAAAEAGLDAEQLEYLRTTVVCVLATDQPALKKQLLPVLAQVLKLPPGDERFEQLMAE